MTDKNIDARAAELTAINWPTDTIPLQGLGKAKDEPDTPEQAAFKKAAQQLAKFLDSKGVKVSHGVAIDALSKSIGYENWRTLRARLAQPLPKPVEGPQYCVDAVYKDNNQLYGDHMDGSSPLDAAIAVMLERLTEFGSSTAVSVSEVRDRYTNEMVLWPTYLQELDLEHVGKALAELCRLARKNLGAPPQRGVDEADAWDRKNLAIEFWTAVSVRPKDVEYGDWKNRVYYEALDNLIEDYEFDSDHYEDEPTMFTDSRGIEQEVNVVELLQELIALAEQGLDMQQLYETKASGVYQVLQMKNILEMHEDRLEVLFNGDDIE